MQHLLPEPVLRVLFLQLQPGVHLLEFPSDIRVPTQNQRLEPGFQGTGKQGLSLVPVEVLGVGGVVPFEADVLDEGVQEEGELVQVEREGDEGGRVVDETVEDVGEAGTHVLLEGVDGEVDEEMGFRSGDLALHVQYYMIK